MRSRWFAVLAALLSSYPLAAETTEKVIAAKGEELPALIEAKQVEATLSDGSYVRGRVRKVTAESVMLDIDATSNPTRFPRGLQQVPKELWLRIRTRERTKGRFVGMVLGGLAGIPVARLSSHEDFTGLWAAPLEAGAPEMVTVRWEELAPLVEKRQIETVLANGVHIRGRVEQVLPQALVVEVKRTSDPNLVPKGPHAGGAGAGLLLHGPLASGTRPSTAGHRFTLAIPYFVSKVGDLNPPAASVAVLGVAPAAVGYLVGAEIDTRSLRVIPEKPGPAPARASSGDPKDQAPIAEGDCNGQQPELPRRTTAQSPMPDAQQAGDLDQALYYFFFSRFHSSRDSARPQNGQ